MISLCIQIIGNMVSRPRGFLGLTRCVSMLFLARALAVVRFINARCLIAETMSGDSVQKFCLWILFLKVWHKHLHFSSDERAINNRRAM